MKPVRDVSGGWFTGESTSLNSLNLAFWVKLTAYDGVKYYSWTEQTPVPSATFIDTDGGRFGSNVLNPVYEANGIVVDVPVFVLVKRAYFDPTLDWVYVFDAGNSQGGTGEEDWPVQIDDGILVNGFYYGHTLAWTPGWTPEVPCWVDDSFTGSTSLPPGENYLSERARNPSGVVITTVGGYFFIAIVDQTGDPLVDGLSWIKLVKLTNPQAPIAYQPYIVVSTVLTDSVLTVVSGSAPTDFSSTIDYNVTDPSANVTAGTVTTVGTDIDGLPITDVVTLSGLGTHTYTTVLSFKTISSITVAGLSGDTGGEDIEAVITIYPRGVLRSESGDYYTTNTATTGVPGVSGDWTLTPLSAGGAWSVGTAYLIGVFVQESRPLYVIKSDFDVDTGIVSINGGTDIHQLITSATITITQPDNATTNIEFVGSGSTVLVLANFGGSGYFPADHFEFQASSPAPLSGITDFIVQVSNTTGTNALIKYLLPEADPSVQHGSITNATQLIGGAKSFGDLATFIEELQAPDSGAQFGTQTGVVYAADVLARTQFIMCANAQPDYQNNTWNNNAIAFQEIDTWSNGGRLTWSVYLAWDGTGSHTISVPTTGNLSSKMLLGFQGTQKMLVFQDEDWLQVAGAYPLDPFGSADSMTMISALPPPAFGILVGSLYTGAWAGINIGGNTIPSVFGLSFAGGLFTGGTPMVSVVEGGSGADLSATGPGVINQPTTGGAFTAVQHSSAGGTTGFTPNASANFVFNESVFAGASGGTAYTLNDIVDALKAIGALAP